MRLKLKVTTKAKQEKVEEMPDGSLKVWVHTAPVKGKANKSVITLCAQHLKIKPSQIKLVMGETNPHKLLQIDT